MKNVMRSFVYAMVVSGTIALPSCSLAVANYNHVDINKLSAQIAALQHEVNTIKSGRRNGQDALKLADRRKIGLHKRAAHQQVSQIAGKTTPQTKLKPETEQQQSSASTATTRGDFFQMTRNAAYLPFDLDVPGQSFVSTGPYVGVPVQYSGSYLIINSPSVNTDLQLLSIRKNILHQLSLLHGGPTKMAPHSHLLFSGIVEGQASYFNQGGAPSKTDIDITNATIDMTMFGPSDWLVGFIEATYDNGLPSGSFYRVSNSRLYVNKAFLTLGDLNLSPFYGTFGQYYVPFGTYSSLMVSDTLPKLLARTKARAVTLGFQQQTTNALYGSAYIFKGDSHAASVSKVNNGGINVGYKFTTGAVTANIGGGILANLGDSGGMQTGAQFQYSEQLVHRTPALNARALVSIGDNINLIAEYVGATTAFNANNLSYNGRAAKPWAMDTQAAYSFYAFGDKPSSIGIGYGKSQQALALGIPQNRYSLVFNTSLRRNTLQSLEFRHDVNYAASKTANGQGGPGAACSSAACSGSGKSDNAVTFQFDYYF